MQRAEDYLRKSIMILQLCSSNSSACLFCDVKEMGIELLFQVWKYMYVAEQSGENEEEGEPMSQDLLDNLYTVINTFLMDEELRARTCSLIRDLTTFFSIKSRQTYLKMSEAKTDEA